ncbi:MAG: hypothetical protein ACKPKO_55075, partial [Candidatus Fonsibacter sp.]
VRCLIIKVFSGINNYNNHFTFVLSTFGSFGFRFGLPTTSGSACGNVCGSVVSALASSLGFIYGVFAIVSIAVGVDSDSLIL